MESGINADILVCRTEHQLSEHLKQKLALFCNVKQEAVIESIDASTIYDVPNLMLEQKLDEITLKMLGIHTWNDIDLTSWNNFLLKHKNATDVIKIGLVGKYVELQDSYKSILESFIHAGAMNDVIVEVVSIHSEFIADKEQRKKVEELHGILVAPGFGERGIKGKIAAVKYAREKNIPFFGICLGLQMAVIEYFRNVIGLKKANSTEMNSKTNEPVIDLMKEQKSLKDKGGTMRLGAWKCKLKAKTKIAKIYNQTSISERHRHRYEFNNKYLDQLDDGQMICSGKNPKTGLVEAIELKEHPWFIAVQYHPEYKSTVANPHPLFVSFVEAAKELAHKQ